jgi:hypothetical protein
LGLGFGCCHRKLQPKDKSRRWRDDENCGLSLTIPYAYAYKTNARADDSVPHVNLLPQEPDVLRVQRSHDPVILKRIDLT